MIDMETDEIIAEFVARDTNSIGVRFEENAPTVWFWLPQSGIEVHVGDPIPGFASLKLPADLARKHGIVECEPY